MYKNRKVSVVIPCYNEEKGIAQTLKAVPSWVYEIIVVDNNSQDKTAQIARGLGAKIIIESKQGYGWACQKGLKSAKGDIIITSDADDTYPLSKIGLMIDRLLSEGLDFMWGNRFPLSSSSAMPWPNILGNHLLTLTMNLLTGRFIKDSQSGMWVLHREILDKIKLTSGKMALSEEIKMEAVCHPQIRFGEMHISYRNRLGRSKLRRLCDGIPNFLFLFKKRWQIYKRRKHR